MTKIEFNGQEYNSKEELEAAVREKMIREGAPKHIIEQVVKAVVESSIVEGSIHLEKITKTKRLKMSEGFLEEELPEGPYAKEHEDSYQAGADLAEWYHTEMPKVGDLVERNEYGEMSYSMPSGDGDAAMVAEVLDGYKVDKDNGHAYNGVIAYTSHNKRVSMFPVDLRRYKKVEAPQADTTKLN